MDIEKRYFLLYLSWTSAYQSVATAPADLQARDCQARLRHKMYAK